MTQLPYVPNSGIFRLIRRNFFSGFVSQHFVKKVNLLIWNEFSALSLEKEWLLSWEYGGAKKSSLDSDRCCNTPNWQQSV